MLALGGLLLVGLDTVGSGNQLKRISQPEVAQAPEVTGEEGTEERSGEKSPGEEGSKEGSGGGSADKESRSAADEKSREDGDSGEAESQKKNSGEKKDDKGGEDNKEPKEEPDPPVPDSNRMWMSVPRLGMQGDTVYNDDSMATMDIGAMKLPPTGFPWEDNANTYITAHRIGYPGTQSDNQFYNLPAMQQNDAIYLSDANGTTYEYRVSDKFAVKPSENWVTEPQPGGDMVTLQTCVVSLDPSTWWDITPALFELGPNSGRLIVQAEKVETYPPQQ